MDDIVEISRAELNLLKQTANVANTIWNDPKHGMAIKEAVKERFPTANLPEVDAVRTAKTAREEAAKIADEAKKYADERISAIEKQFKDRDEESRKAKEESAFMTDIEATKKKYNLTAEGMDKVFARMKEKNNPDVESAAAWVTDHEPKQSPVASSNYSPQNLDLYGSASADKEWEELNKNPLRFGDAEVTRILNDFSNGQQGKYREFGGSL